MRFVLKYLKPFSMISEVGLWTSYECLMCGCEFSVLGELPLPYESQSQCRVYVEWSERISHVQQISILKKLVPSIETMSNSELLEYARRKERLEIGIMYLSEGQNLAENAKKQGVSMSLQDIEKELERYEV